MTIYSSYTQTSYIYLTVVRYLMVLTARFHRISKNFSHLGQPTHIASRLSHHHILKFPCSESLLWF